MKAAVHRQYGPPEVVRVENIPTPVPGENEILIKVHYTTVNRTDCGFRSAEYFVSRLFSGLFRPKQQTLGNEFSGVVEQIGAKVKLFKPGDRVYGFNDQFFGAHAEYLRLPADSAICHIPENLNFEQAVALCEGTHYAWSDIQYAKVKPGANVLVYGATGAIGSAAVQLLKYVGARVTAVCPTKHLDVVKSLGPDRIIDYQTEDFTKSGEKYSLIFDAVGKSSFGVCKALLIDGGAYVSTELGKNGQNVFMALIPGFLVKKHVLFPLPKTKVADMQLFGKLASEGKLKILHDRTYSLDQIVEAYQYVESAQKLGNVLIRMT